MAATALKSAPAPLIKADTALRSFRDGGYILADAVGETVDNSLQSGAKKIHIDWKVSEIALSKGKSPKMKRQIEWFAIADNGSGIAAELLANVLTIGFSTRYGSREGIGRFGVGFKLASISQAKRLEVYTRPAYLKATKNSDADGRDAWSFSEPNTEGRVFASYLDLDEIDAGNQDAYQVKEVENFPDEFVDLMTDAETGTLIVWRKLDRLNNEKSFAEKVDEKLSVLKYFLRRTYRIFINNGIEILLNGDDQPLLPYDPSFELDNPEAERLANGKPMKGELVEEDVIEVEGHKVKWRVQLTPAITRLEQQGGGDNGPDAKGQFKKLHIPENEGKISFLRHDREISYTTVPKMLPTGVEPIDRYIAIEIAFPPALDEYFQVKHIKRGAEPVDKLRELIRKALKKPVVVARTRIRQLWEQTKQITPKSPEDASGGRSAAEEIVKNADAGLPVGQAGMQVTPSEDETRLREVASDAGVQDPVQQDDFIKKIRSKPLVALDVDHSGSGLLEIEHLTNQVIVRINRRHPFIKEVYSPLKSAISSNLEGVDTHELRGMLQKAADGIDLLFFAYAKAENQSRDPEDDYLMLREDWGKFAAVYIRDRSKVAIT